MEPQDQITNEFDNRLEYRSGGFFNLSDLEIMKAIKVKPLAGLAAIKNNMGGAFRAWTVAQNLSNDSQVSGKEVKSTLLHFGVHPRTAARWIAQAEDLGLLGCDPDSDAVYYMSWGKAGAIFGSRWIGQPAYTKNPERLFRAGWQSLLWEMFELGFEEKVISRQTKEKITGVSPRTQLNYETPAIEKRANFAKVGQILPTGKDWKEHVENLRHEFGRGYLFNRHGEIIRQLPNLYLVHNPNIGTYKACKREPKAELEQFSHEKTHGDHGNISANKRYFGSLKKGKQRAEKAARKHGGERYYLQKVGDNLNTWQQVVL